MSNNKALAASNQSQITPDIVALLFKDTHKALLAAAISCVVLLFALRNSLTPKPTVLWVSLLLIAYVLRLICTTRYTQSSAKTTDSQAWLSCFRFTSSLCGLAWGSASFFIFPQHNTELQAFMALILAGICAGALINYSIDSKTAIGFVGGAALLASPAFMLENSSFSIVILVMAYIFTTYMAIASKRLARGLIDNITLRVDAENQKNQISALSQKQNLHMEHTPMGVIEWDANLVITSWNKACASIFGYSTDEVLGKHAGFLMSELNNKSTNTNIVETFLNQDQDHLKKILHKNGDIIYCELFNTIIKDSLTNEVVGYASLVQDKTAFVQTQEKIHQLAYYDVLTGLPNRGLLLDRLNQAIAACERTQSYAMLVFIDLDHFKTINDIKGHAAGDFLLRTIASRMQKTIRKQDTVARMGGDEFVLVFGEIGQTADKALTFSHQIVEKISQAIKVPVDYDAYQHQSSASVGICLFKDNNLSADELLRRADMAMYLAKKKGRNCYEHYDESMQPKYDYQMQLKQDLNHALVNNQMQIVLQGQFDNDLQSIGAEILLRWFHPQLGLIMPADFIPIAEESGLIIPIGHWVLQQACTLIKKWESSPTTRNLTVSVNVSALQFNHVHFIDQVENAVKLANCDASKLCIELTESAVIQNIDDVATKMNLLRSMGISLAIDDFGIGYSSLSILKGLPLTELKIDRSFVNDMVKSDVEASIVQTILQMGKNLKLRIVAEGVETEQQMAALQHYGCGLFQGYFFERPCEVNTFEKNLSLKEPKLEKIKA
jgi:diguanylate cyclase (GGDEF)-like protein/PAS domain S-box-containing protein